MAEGAFVTVYHEDLIANYPGVWDDDRMLATWLRLLVIADKLWPSPADIPRGVRTRELAQLVKLELVQELPNHRFRLRGLDARRKRQQEIAKSAASARWNAPRNAPSNASASHAPNAGAMPTRPLPDQTITKESAARALVAMPLIPVKGMNGEVTEVDLADANPDLTRLQRLAEELTGTAYAMANVYGGHGKMAADALARHGFERVARQWRACTNQVKAAGTSAPTLKQLVFYADDVLNAPPSAREGTREEAQAEEQARFDRRVANTRARNAELETTG